MSERFYEYLADGIAAVRDWRERLIILIDKLVNAPPDTVSEVLQLIEEEARPKTEVFSEICNSGYYSQYDIVALLSDDYMSRAPISSVVVHRLKKVVTLLSSGIQAAEKDLPSKTLPATVAPAGQSDETKAKPKKKKQGRPEEYDTASDISLYLKWHEQWLSRRLSKREFLKALGFKDAELKEKLKQIDRGRHKVPKDDSGKNQP
jgi:hypothetical protein